MTEYKGFTLIELLVVMGIIALMTGLGIYGLVRFQENAQLQTTFNDVYSLLKTVQNNARNSVSFVNESSLTPSICSSEGNCVPDYFGIRFEANNYEVYACLKVNQNIICPAENQIETPGISIPGINIDYQGDECSYIVFERLTGDIEDVAGNPLWTVTGNTTCNLNISNGYGDNRTIEIDLITNTIKDV